MVQAHDYDEDDEDDVRRTEGREESHQCGRFVASINIAEHLHLNPLPGPSPCLPPYLFTHSQTWSGRALALSPSYIYPHRIKAATPAAAATVHNRFPRKLLHVSLVPCGERFMCRSIL